MLKTLGWYQTRDGLQGPNAELGLKNLALKVHILLGSSPCMKCFKVSHVAFWREKKKLDWTIYTKYQQGGLSVVGFF